MLIPINWLKEFVEIKLPLKDLMWKMTEAGLTCESYKKVGEEIVLDVEVTANRPDWMSIIGVAREVAAIQGLKMREIKEKPLPKKTANFPLDLVPNFELFERWTGIVIKDIQIKPSPKFIAERIKQMGHEPINNIIDITNYVMYELGLPMHAFDYDEISGQIMKVQKSKGGEDFTSVDGINYKLPKDAIVIYDDERLIDLAGIKGGLNSGIRVARSEKESTKNIFLHITIDNPALVRRASQALGLRSDASAIYERGPDKGGVVKAIDRAVGLILKYGRGEIASDLIDIKKEDFKPRKLEVNFEKMNKVLGIEISLLDATTILDKLNLSPKKTKTGIECIVPTYRGDLKIEEDLIEEVARIYGYNKFPKTLPQAQTSFEKIPYYFDDSFILKLKEVMIAAGFSEAMTLSLISQDLIEKFNLNAKNHVKLENPVSLEYEYMRASLIPSLINGLRTNNEGVVKLFEVSKIYPEEDYKTAAVAKGIDFRTFKGVIDLIIKHLNIEKSEIVFETDKPYLHPSKSATLKIGADLVGEFGELSPDVADKMGIKNEVFCFEIDVKTLQKHAKINFYKSVPENPAQIEDITLTFPPKTRIGEVAKIIALNPLVCGYELSGIYKDNYTFRIWYQHPNKNLTDPEVKEARDKIISSLKTKFGATIKD